MTDPKPKRRDGLVEREGVWGDVGVGSVLAGRLKSDIWEVTDVAHPQQIEPGKSLWVRMVNRKTGEEVSVPPRLLTKKVTFLLEDEGQSIPVPLPASDAEAIALVVEKLGATELATQDATTGEIWCPDPHSWFDPEEILNHLRVAHGMDTTDLTTPELYSAAHGRAHAIAHPTIGKGGFPHRHVPEEILADGHG